MLLSLLAAGLALMSGGCASTRASSDATTPAVGWSAKPAEAKPEPVLKADPVGQAVYIASGLTQIGSNLLGGK